MDHPEELALPFLTRKMLSFDHGTTMSIRIRSRSTGANGVTLRGATREGIFSFAHTTLGIGGTFTETFRIPDVPLFLVVLADSSTIQQGEIFVQVQLLMNNDIVQELVSGYITGIRSLGWPAANLEDTRPGGGVIDVIESADPDAGAELDDIVNGNEYWRIQAIRFQLVTDANMANRRVHVTIDDGTNVLLDFIASNGQVASETVNYTFAPFGAINDSLDDADIVSGIPNNLILPNPFHIRTDTTNLLAGDNFGVMRILAERFFA